MSGLGAVVEIERRLGSQLPDDPSSIVAGEMRRDEVCAFAGRSVGSAATGYRAAVFCDDDSLPDLRPLIRSSARMRLPIVIHHVADRGHEAFAGASETGAYQLFATDVQEAADFAVIARVLAETTLTPVICTQDAALTARAIQTIDLVGTSDIEKLAGRQNDVVSSPTAAQDMAFGSERARVPSLVDIDRPLGVGGMMDADTAFQAGVAEEAFYTEAMAKSADDVFSAFAEKTGRRYSLVSAFSMDDAEYVVIAQGPIVRQLRSAAAHLRRERGIRVGVLGITLFRPFPYDRIAAYLTGRKVTTVLDCGYQPSDLRPLLRDVRIATANAGHRYSGVYGSGPARPTPKDLYAVLEHVAAGGEPSAFYIGARFETPDVRLPLLERQQQATRRAYPQVFRKILSAVRINGHASHPASTVLQIRTARREDADFDGGLIAGTLFTGLNVPVSGGPGDDPGNPRAGGVFTVVVNPGTDVSEEKVGVLLMDSPAFLINRACREVVGEGGIVIVDTALGVAGLRSELPASVLEWIQERDVGLVTLDAAAIGTACATDPLYAPLLRRAAAVGAVLRHGLGGNFSGAGGAAEEGVAGLRGLSRDSGVSSVPGGSAAEASAPDEAIAGAFKSTIDVEFGSNAELVNLSAEAMRIGWETAKDVDRSPAPEPVAPASEAPPPPEVQKSGSFGETLFDLTRLWKTTGYLTRLGERDGTLADPFLAVPAMPANSSTAEGRGLLYPQLPVIDSVVADASPALWSYCPESAISAAVHDVETILGAALGRCKDAGKSFVQLPRVEQHLARQMHRVMSADELGRFRTWGEVLGQAASELIVKMNPPDAQREALSDEIRHVMAVAPELPLIRAERFFKKPERERKGSGRVFTWAVDPELCNSCGLCAAVVDAGAIRMEIKSDELVGRSAQNASFIRNLPDVSLESLAGAVSSVESPSHLDRLLHGAPARARLGGGDAVPGDGARLAMRLIFAAVDVHLRPAAAELGRTLQALEERIKQDLQRQIAGAVEVNDFDAFGRRLKDIQTAVLDAAAIGQLVDQEEGREGVRREAVNQLSEALSIVRRLGQKYVADTEQRALTATVLSSTALAPVYPANPYPFPWIATPGDEAPDVASGILEGVHRRMSETFGDVRRAKALIAGDAEPLPETLKYSDFAPEERAACPPTIVVVDAYSDALRRLLSHERPLKVVLIDGAAGPGQDDATLAILAAQNAYVAQCSIGYADHLMQCVSEALSHDGPAMIRVYAPHPERDGIRPAAVIEQARLAVRSRAVPLFTYDPSRGPEISERLDLSANPAAASDWVTDSNGGDAFTYADWAAREGRFYDHFRVIPKRDWDRDFIPLSEYRAGKDQGRPFVEVTGVGGAVVRKEVLQPVLEETIRRAETWHFLQELAGVRSSLADRLRRESEAAIAAAREQAEMDVTRMHEATAVESQAEQTRETHQMLTARLMQLSGIHKDEDA